MSRPTSTESGRHRRTDMPPAMMAGIALFFVVACALLLPAVPWSVEAHALSDPVDLAGHWALPAIKQAIAGGYASCYADGTFRPDSRTTRNEFLRLLVDATESQQVGIVAHEALRCLFGDDIQLDEPVSRLETTVMVIAAHGRYYQAKYSTAEALRFADASDVLERARGWVAEAAREGVVRGYPDNTFLGAQALTRAEAVVIVQRVLDLMDSGIDPTLRLIVDGKEWTGLPLARRGDIVYAPASAVYGLLSDTHLMPAWDRLGVFPGNGVFRYGFARIQVVPGAPFACVSRNDSERDDETMLRFALLGPTYMRKGEMMLPVASVSKDGCLPYSSGRFDFQTNAVYLTTAPDWPGNRLPSSLSEAGFVFRDVIPTLYPGALTTPNAPRLEDQDGNWIHSQKPLPPVTYSVDPASPLRLIEVRNVHVAPGEARLEFGVPSTRVVQSQGVYEVGCTVPVMGPEVLVPEGEFAITATIPGVQPATLMVTVEDRRPCRFSVKVTPAQSKAGEYVAVITFLDNRGRVVDFSCQDGWMDYRGPSLRVTAPDGTALPASPILVPDHLAGVPPKKAGWDFIVIRGISKFTFPVAGPGVYRIVVSSLLPPNTRGTWGDTLTEIRAEVEVILPR